MCGHLRSKGIGRIWLPRFLVGLVHLVSARFMAEKSATHINVWFRSVEVTLAIHDWAA